MRFVAGLCVSSLDLCFALPEEAAGLFGGEQQHCFLLWQISTTMYLSASLETVPILLWGQGIVFGFFSWAGAALLSCAWSFYCRIKAMKPAFATRHDTVKRFVALYSIPLQEL